MIVIFSICLFDFFWIFSLFFFQNLFVNFFCYFFKFYLFIFFCWIFSIFFFIIFKLKILKILSPKNLIYFYLTNLDLPKRDCWWHINFYFYAYLAHDTLTPSLAIVSFINFLSPFFSSFACHEIQHRKKKYKHTMAVSRKRIMFVKNVIFHITKKQRATLSWHIIITPMTTFFPSFLESHGVVLWCRINMCSIYEVTSAFRSPHKHVTCLLTSHEQKCVKKYFLIWFCCFLGIF